MLYGTATTLARGLKLGPRRLCCVPRRAAAVSLRIYHALATGFCVPELVESIRKRGRRRYLSTTSLSLPMSSKPGQPHLSYQSGWVPAPPHLDPFLHSFPDTKTDCRVVPLYEGLLPRLALILASFCLPPAYPLPACPASCARVGPNRPRPTSRFLIRRKTLGHASSSSSFSGASWPKAYGGEGHDEDASAEPPTLGRLSSGSGSRGSSLYLSCLSSGEGVKVML